MNLLDLILVRLELGQYSIMYTYIILYWPSSNLTKMRSNKFIYLFNTIFNI